MKKTNTYEVVVSDYNEHGEEEIMGAVKKLGLFSYIINMIGGSTCDMFILSKKELSKKDINAIKKEHGWS